VPATFAGESSPVRSEEKQFSVDQTLATPLQAQTISTRFGNVMLESGVESLITISNQATVGIRDSSTRCSCFPICTLRADR